MAAKVTTTWHLVQQNIKESLTVSSISGVSYTVSNPKRSLVERTFWIVTVLLMVALATWQGLVVYTHYKERPVIVTLDKAYFDWNLTFPTATICFEDLKSESELKKVIKDGLIGKYNFTENLLSSEFDSFVQYLRDLAFKNYSNYDDYEAYASGKKKEYLPTSLYMEVLDQVVYTLNFPKPKRGRMKNSPIKYFGSEMEQAIRIYTEIGPCMVVNPYIGIYYTPGYFVINKPYEGYKQVHYTANEMASMTLKVNADVKSSIYFHAPNEVMDILSKKIVIEKGFYTQVAFQTATVVTSEDVMPLTVKQQKKCRLPYEPKEEPLKHSPVYSYKLCKFECRIKIATERCQCVPYYYRRLPTEPTCNLTGLYCLSKFKDDLIYVNTSTKQCQFCPENCDVNMFRPSTSTKDEFFQTTYEMFIQFPKNVYVRTLIFSEVDLTVQIGGIFGLFLGCSLLSVVEVVYCLSIRLYCGCGMQKRKKNTSP